MMFLIKAIICIGICWKLCIFCSETDLWWSISLNIKKRCCNCARSVSSLAHWHCWSCIKWDLLVFYTMITYIIKKKGFYFYIIEVTCDINMGTLLLLNEYFFVHLVAYCSTFLHVHLFVDLELLISYKQLLSVVWLSLLYISCFMHVLKLLIRDI